MTYMLLGAVVSAIVYFLPGIVCMRGKVIVLNLRMPVIGSVIGFEGQVVGLFETFGSPGLCAL